MKDRSRLTAGASKGIPTVVDEVSVQMIKDLTDRTVLLTGAPGGLGPNIASHLHAQGASLVLSGRDRANLEALTATLAPARFVVADLSRQEEVERLATAAGQV